MLLQRLSRTVCENKWKNFIEKLTVFGQINLIILTEWIVQLIHSRERWESERSDQKRRCCSIDARKFTSGMRSQWECCRNSAAFQWKVFIGRLECGSPPVTLPLRNRSNLMAMSLRRGCGGIGESLWRACDEIATNLIIMPMFIGRRIVMWALRKFRSNSVFGIPRIPEIFQCKRTAIEVN